MKEVIITKLQLEALISYYKMHGVDEMKFQLDHLEDTLQSFGPQKVEVFIDIPPGRCCFHIDPPVS